MIVVDGPTDEEKLRELLAGGAEETSLSFKATLDLAQRSSKAVLDFVKDAISMGNLPEGGYIVVGVNELKRGPNGPRRRSSRLLRCERSCITMHERPAPIFPLLPLSAQPMGGRPGD